MKNFLITLIVTVLLIIGGFFAYNWFINRNNQTRISTDNYNAQRTLTEEQNIKNTNPIIQPKPTETELKRFSTPLIDDSKNRVNNIKITCSKINGTIVKSGEEFSFCDIVGQPSSDKGYKKADAFGKDGKVIKAIGGGNCQVSTTIYNAVLKTKGLRITERHEHSRDVAYIKDGKDATVAYDYFDLKFKNNNDYDIKLYASVNKDKVAVKIMKID